MSADIIKNLVEGWGDILEAVAAYSSNPEEAKRILARVMADPQNGVRAVAALSDAIRAAIEHTHRALAIKRLMLDYLAAQGLEGEPLALLQEQAALEDADNWKRKQRERATLEDAFLRGPAAYAEAVKDYAMQRRRQARRDARKGYRPPRSFPTVEVTA